MKPRPYQEEGLQALHEHVCTKDTNPCVVIPTGGGKSAMIAWAIQRWHQEYPAFRCCILAHRKELIEQNSDEMRAIYNECRVGIYAASLGRRDTEESILFSSIDSVYRRAGEFAPWDVIMVDEAHRIPFSGEGKYRRFIRESAEMERLEGNVCGDRKTVRGSSASLSSRRPTIIGWTATPFRMNGGDICHKDHILQEVCYEAGVVDLIAGGYLSQLRSKAGIAQPKLDGVRRNSGGDYVLKSLAEATNEDKLIVEAVVEAVGIIRAEGRKSVVFFCVDVEHCEKVSHVLAGLGFNAPVVIGNTQQTERDRISTLFKAGKIEGVCNVNVYTEGFNAERVDCIVLLRPTLSPGLYSQMVGRGLRSHVRKLDCLVLDFAGCIEEHGPIDCLSGQPSTMAVCLECRESFSRAIRECPACGWKIPKREVVRLEAAESVKRMHATKASKKSILSEPEVRTVDAVFVARHHKDGEPDAVRVSYRTGRSLVTELVEPDSADVREAVSWLNVRGLEFRPWPWKDGIRCTDFLLSDMFLSQKVKEWTKTITVVKGKRKSTIMGYNEPMKQ